MITLNVKQIKEIVLENNVPLDSYDTMINALIELPIAEHVHFRIDRAKIAYTSLTKKAK
jgi:hypothetical protein